MFTITEILNVLSEVSQNVGTKAYICGGLPRDKAMGRLFNINDIDITTGDRNIHFVAKEAAMKMNVQLKENKDGHSSIHLENYKIDFSSNYILPNLKATLEKNGLKNPTSLQMEMYSRDFTCNALLMELDLKTITDPLGLGFNDIKKNRIRTCMPAYVTLGNDNKRIVRIVYLAAKLGFKIDDEIVDWVRNHPESLIEPDQQYVVKKLHEAFKLNPEIAAKSLDDLDLWKYVPPSDLLTPYLTQGVGRL